MAGKEIDPQRARAARDVVRQHPAMVLVAASPLFLVAGLVWWLTGSAGWAIVLLAVALVAGGWAVMRKR